MSRLVERMPQIKEIDLDPVFARPDGAVVVDACVVIASGGAGKGDDE